MLHYLFKNNTLLAACLLKEILSRMEVVLMTE